MENRAKENCSKTSGICVMCRDTITNCTKYMRYCDTESYSMKWALQKCARTCGFCDELSNSSTLSVSRKADLSSTTSQSTPPDTNDIFGTYPIAIIVGSIAATFCIVFCIVCVILNKKNKRTKKKQHVDYAVMDESVTVVTSSASQYDEIEEKPEWESGNSATGTAGYETDKKNSGLTDNTWCQRNLKNQYDHIKRNEVNPESDDCTIVSTHVGDDKRKKMWNSYDHITGHFDKHDQSQYSHIEKIFPNTPESSKTTIPKKSSASNYFILDISDNKS